MHDVLVSVIIPVYNSSLYIRECLLSVVDQTHPLLEIICVNDGSTDTSSTILSEFARKDPRILVISQDNQGVSAARNRGLDVARGEFVLFVDSDDTIASDAVSTLVESLHSDIDYVMESKTNTEFTGGKAQLKEFIYWGLRTQKINSPCGKLYRRSVIDDRTLRFPLETSLGEDLIFNLEYLQKVRGVCVNSGSRYHIRRRADSLSRTSRLQKYDELMFVHDHLQELLSPQPGSRCQSLLNFLRIRGLLSCTRSLIHDDSRLDKKQTLARLRSMEVSNGSLPVRHGDLTMRLVGLLYNWLGLVRTQKIVARVKSIRRTTR